MSCFDVVIVTCPKCAEDIEFQSKGGHCYLNTFYLSASVPDSVLSGILGSNGATFCEGCKSKIQLHVPSTAVQVRVICNKPNEKD